MLIYIHGFSSSPASVKAQLLKARLEALGRGAEFVAPALPPSPAQAAQLLDALATRHPGAALVGSSLGGYYATWLAEQHGLKAVLLNPAVRPYELLSEFVGRQKRFHSDEEYDFTRQHVDELRAFEVARVTPARYLLIVATGDEVLDYRRAVERYRGCRQIVIEGGDHGLSDFSSYLDTVLEFCGSAHRDAQHR
ncbi:MAG TPA: YqiA/YcfP family alpha/beta fold hydrolase [Burkholderiales bacterium]|nr:YqiA/YcfP family alpha/beta fold hydrolase [Burkholderiales bacterium]